MADLATATDRAPMPHVPVKDDNLPKTRRKLLFFDRVKVLVLVGVLMFFTMAKKFSDLPGVISRIAHKSLGHSRRIHRLPAG